MQLLHAHIENFKGLRDVALVARRDHADRPALLTALTGDNGCGKTSALQAIALALGLATRKLRTGADLEWYGFLHERIGSRGRTQVDLTLRMDDDELDAVAELYELWRTSRTRADYPLDQDLPVPTREREVHVQLRDGAVRVAAPANATQLYGRFFVKILLKEHPGTRRYFSRVGDVFWFDQSRNLASAENDPSDGTAASAWESSVRSLRRTLLDWWAYHQRPDADPLRDYTARLERMLGDVFPGTRFVGPEPVGPGSSDLWFLLERDGARFDIAELSSGEQSTFALMHPFAFQSIERSVVLVDEVELHLHPGAQQAFLRELRKIGPSCQWWLTTHSRYVTDALPSDTIRLPGGTPCL